MTTFSLFATIRNLIFRVENAFLVLGILVLIARLVPRLRKRKRLVGTATTLSIGAALAFVILVSVVPLWPFVNYLNGPAEHHLTDGDAPECIVVLGSGLVDRDTLSRSSYNRTLCGIMAFRRTKARLLVLSGGDPMNVGVTEAALMADVADRLEVPQDRIRVEGRSNTTRLNALYTAELLKPDEIKTVALVTSPTSCRRAYLAFRKVGLEPKIVDCGIITRLAGPDPPVSLRKISLFDSLLYEAVGLLFYKLRGWA